MKTLDEVITAHEFCVNASMTGAVCEECPVFAKPDCGIRDDALHYLKAYRSDKAEWEAQKKAYEDWIEQYKDARDKHQQAVIELKKNDPLSWDELKQMEGKPVWVEIIGQKLPIDSSWGIATSDSYKTWQGVESWTLVRPGAHYSLAVADYGKTWQAYRKRSGDEI